MASSRAWANALNIGCAFVAAYALLVIAVSHFHPHGPHGPHGAHHGPPRHGTPVEHFAWLALVTAATGIAAGCTTKRRYLVAFPILLLITELVVLFHISRGAVHRVQMCNLANEHSEITARYSAEVVAPGIAVVREQISVGEPQMDFRARDRCVEGVRHCVLLSCLIVGVICTALTCCSSRLAGNLRVEAEAAAAVEASSTVVVQVQGEVVKADPLEDGEMTESAAMIPRGRVVLITRV